MSNINCPENLASYNPRIKIGHSYKLCPYSDTYYTAWGLLGTASPEVEDPRGNSRTYPYGAHNPAGAPHPKTGGGMVMKNRGAAPGFICIDPNCPHFITHGFQYFEI